MRGYCDIRCAIKELLSASSIAIMATLLVGFIGGIEALGGYLAESIFFRFIVCFAYD